MQESGNIKAVDTDVMAMHFHVVAHLFGRERELELALWAGGQDAISFSRAPIGHE